jgi:hypothetical protein
MENVVEIRETHSRGAMLIFGILLTVVYMVSQHGLDANKIPADRRGP